MDERDILVDDEGAMIIRNGSFATGESLTQEVGLILLTNKGEIRHDMLCGCDLRRKVNGRLTQSQLDQIIKVQLERDGKNYTDLKNGIILRTNA